MALGEKYVLDIDAIVKFCFDNDGKTTDSEITEVYVADEESKNLSLASKQLREVKNGDVTSMQTMKYDLVKLLIVDLMEMDEDELSLGDTVIMNTMMNEGFLKPIE